MNNNINHNQKLKELLNNNSSGNKENADEFEKAAMEGFAMLESENEALELKRSLDIKLNTEVFVAKKQESRKLFWLAAAALIGAVGFSIYFFQSSSSVKNDGLAIQQPTVSAKNKIAEDSELPHGKKALNEVFEAAPSEGGQITDSKKTIKSLNSEGKQTMNETSQQDKVKLSNSGANNLPTMVSEKSEGDEKTVKLNDEIAIQKRNEDMPTPPTAGVSRSSSAETESRKNKKSEKEETRDDAAATQSQLEDIVTISTKSAPFCYYDGGDVELKKDLKEKLVREDLLFRFDALLLINKKGKIEKVILTNVTGLSSDVQNNLIQVLMSFSKFKVSGKPKKDEKLEYKIEFRP